MDRQSLRQATLAARDRLGAEERARASAAIGQRLRNLPPFQQAQTLLFYVNFKSEVATRELMAHCLAQGQRVAAPLTIPHDSRLVAYEIREPELDLRPGSWGIPEPDPRRCQELDPTQLDLVLVPGAVFDRQGNRLGYGGGYYDRFFANLAPQALRVALCFQLQLAPAIPAQSHDVPVHYLITEEEVIRTAP
ncbi:MAG: 5-formyltetrahydrofolate cyclo-ligase [Thermodesulfobacteriota bacterium]